MSATPVCVCCPPCASAVPPCEVPCYEGPCDQMPADCGQVVAAGTFGAPVGGAQDWLAFAGAGVVVLLSALYLSGRENTYRGGRWTRVATAGHLR